MSELFPAVSPAETVPQATGVRTPLSYLGGSRRNPWIGRIVFLVAIAAARRAADDPRRPDRGHGSGRSTSATPPSPSASTSPGATAACSCSARACSSGSAPTRWACTSRWSRSGPGSCPSFMSLYGDQTELPLVWKPFENLWVTVVLALLVPMALAGAFGWLVFSRRVRGPYFALLSQAMALDLHADHGRPAEDVRRHERPHRLPDRVRAQQVRAGDEHVPLLRRRRAARRRLPRRPAPRAQPVRAAAAGRARPRGPRPLPRLQPGRRQDVRVRRRRRRWPARPAPSRPR